MAKPIITASVVDTNPTTIALTGNKNTLIRYFSNAKATMTVESDAALNEDFYIIRNGNDTEYGKEHTFNNVESDYFTFSAEDEYGNIGTAQVTADMVYYDKPTCNIFIDNIDGSGSVSISCMGYFFYDTFGAEYNTLTVQYRYGIYGSSPCGWIDMEWDIFTNNNSYQGYQAAATVTGLKYQYPYVFEVRAFDKLMATEPSSSGVIKCLPIFHWSKDDFVFEVPVTFNAGATGADGDGDKKINGNLDVTGDMRLKGNANYGNTLFFGDGAYCYISESEDDVMYIKANAVNFITSTGSFTLPKIEQGEWTPTLSAYGTTYASRKGWYIKVGKQVTAGFYIKATCGTGVSSYDVKISGVPFAPSCPVASGGLCSGAYISGGFNFQCFVAETDQTITTRVQECNNTSTKNLGTSASGCKYPSGGGDLTLSGTITFMANS